MPGATYYATWFENAAFAWVALSALASLGANTGYSVALGCFVLHSAIYRNPRTTLIAGGLTSLCLLVDVIYCTLHGHTLQSSGHEYVFAFVLILLSMLVKGAALFCAYQLSLADGYRFTSPIIGGPTATAGSAAASTTAYHQFNPNATNIPYDEDELSEEAGTTVSTTPAPTSYQNLDFGVKATKSNKGASL